MSLNHSIIPLLALSIIFGSSKYDGSTTASVTLAGGIISANKVVNTKKYKRKNCPICKGAGWYISGDKITKVPCGYCEPDLESPLPPSVLIQPNYNCLDGSCSSPKKTIIRI